VGTLISYILYNVEIVVVCCHISLNHACTYACNSNSIFFSYELKYLERMFKTYGILNKSHSPANAPKRITNCT
jgi:hypothetical protein